MTNENIQFNLVLPAGDGKTQLYKECSNEHASDLRKLCIQSQASRQQKNEIERAKLFKRQIVLDMYLCVVSPVNAI